MLVEFEYYNINKIIVDIHYFFILIIKLDYWRRTKLLFNHAFIIIISRDVYETVKIKPILKRNGLPS